MAENDELGKSLREDDIPKKRGIDAGSSESKSDTLAPKARPEHDVGVDAERDEED